jgi:hypothetical protein
MNAVDASIYSRRFSAFGQTSLATSFKSMLNDSERAAFSSLSLSGNWPALKIHSANKHVHTANQTGKGSGTAAHS